MKRLSRIVTAFFIISLFISGCGLINISNPSLQQTQIAMGIQSTQLSLQQTQIALPTEAPEPTTQPTYTPYPTYTAQAPLPQPTVEVVPTQESFAEPAFILFDDWKEDVNILLYDNMYLFNNSGNMISVALDGLGFGDNTTNVKDAMGTFLTQLNSGTQWDLIIVGGEFRDAISGDYFDMVADQVDNGVSVIIEIWYIDQVYHGRVQPLMQRCGIALDRDWQMAQNANLNDYLVYLLDPSDPLFSNPNTISLLSPTFSHWWILDVGDLVKKVPGSDAKLMAGAYPKEYSSYGLIAECMDGRMIWQTFSTHNYKYNDMINLWQNYIINTLQARWEYVN